MGKAAAVTMIRRLERMDLDTICHTLMALGQLGFIEPSIAEIDINPLIISPDGAVTAVDALIILEENRPL